MTYLGIEKNKYYIYNYFRLLLYDKILTKNRVTDAIKTQKDS